MIKITEDELRQMVELHGMWLRMEKDGRRADLTYANLKGANLRDANLKGANLTYAKLTRAILDWTDIPVVPNLDSAILAAIETDPASSPNLPVPDFYATNEEALADIRARVAQETI